MNKIHKMSMDKLEKIRSEIELETNQRVTGNQIVDRVKKLYDIKITDSAIRTRFLKIGKPMGNFKWMNREKLKRDRLRIRLCSCGCGAIIPMVSGCNRYRRYVSGHYWNGKHRSKEVIEKMRVGAINHIHSEEEREKRRQKAIDKNPINSEYFKTLNIRNTYVLGYLFADGHFRKRKIYNGLKTKFHIKMGLSFISIDKELIDKIKIEFGIKNRKTRVIHRNNHWNDRYIISISNYHFLRYLENLGMFCGKKCDRISIPKAIAKNKLLFIAFFRGFFDGDGSINSIKNTPYPRIAITTASYKFLLQLKTIMNKFDIKSKQITKAKSSRVFRLRFSGKENLYRLYKFMYQDANGLYLTRKKQRFDEYFKAYDWKII